VRLAEHDEETLRAAGIDPDELARLRALSALDLSRLAGMRALVIGVALGGGGLKAGLRGVALANEAKSLETYFIRHGASWQMMKTLFKVRHKLTLERRRELGAWRPPGRLRLPDAATCEQIGRTWLTLREANPRMRYLRLHQAFADLPIATLAAVVARFEA
jgi:hypothetical protein